MGSCFSSDETAAAELDYAISSGKSLSNVDGWQRRVKNIDVVLPISSCTPLELAITNQNASIVKLLLNRGADTEQKSDRWLTPLIRACYHGNPDIVSLLIEHGADITARACNGTTCLSMAAKNGHLSVVSYLLEQQSCPIGEVEADCYTSLHHAVLLNDPDLVSNLISKGVDINAETQDGETPLFLASKNNCIESLRVLLDCGADANICTKAGDGESPLLEATSKGNAEAVQMLLCAGEDVKQGDDKNGAKLLLACSAGSLEMVKLLAAKGADLEFRTHDGLTCLFVAAKNKHRSVVSYLLQQESCSVDVVDGVGYTLLHHVAMFNDPVATSTLISKGLDIDAKTQDGETPIFLAIKHSCLASFGVLVDSGADLNIKTKNGEFALTEAVNQGDVDLVKLLLEHGADSTPFIQRGQSPIDLALQVSVARIANNNPHPSIVQIVNERNEPSVLETASNTAELASNVIGLFNNVVGR